LATGAPVRPSAPTTTGSRPRAHVAMRTGNVTGAMATTSSASEAFRAAFRAAF